MNTRSNNDMYDFGNYNPALETQGIENDLAFQTAVRTSHGRKPPFQSGAAGFTGGRLTTGRVPTASQKPGARGQLGTAMGTAQPDAARPMTAMRAAGFTSGAKRPEILQKPSNESKGEENPDDKLKQLEKKISDMIEESVIAGSQNNYKKALEIAKEAARSEKMLVRQREQMTSDQPLNLDLTYSVLLNLAIQQEANEMYADALQTYQVIVKSKTFPNIGRLNVNIGNIYMKQRNFMKALKHYRMGLDQVQNAHRYLRIRITHNIGVAFVKLGQYQEAIQSFEFVMAETPSFQTGFNLIICHYAMANKEGMKAAFQKMLTVDLKIDEDRYVPNKEDKQRSLLLEAVRNDSLRQYEKEKRFSSDKCIKTAAKLIAPMIEPTFDAGYDWCIDQVKVSRYADLAAELEIDKAIMFLKAKEFQQAVDLLKKFERKESKIAATAALNLSFLYYLENDLNYATRYADLSIQSDRYNPSALVNRGNCFFSTKEFDKAADYYREALGNDSACVEALFNLGLSLKRLNRYPEALDCFNKLQYILRHSSQVLYHIADIYDRIGDNAQAQEWYLQVISIVPSDPSILKRLGQLADNEGEKSRAFQHYFDSYRYYPSNIEVIEWLGAYYIDTQFCDKAIKYFERASVVQPQQVKWQLMVASCYRRSGNYQQALETYKNIHKRFPEDTECLKFLVRLCADMGLGDAQEYANRLKRVEKTKQLRDQRAESAGRKSSANSSGGQGTPPDSSSAVRGGPVNAQNSGKGVLGRQPSGDGTKPPMFGGGAALAGAPNGQDESGSSGSGSANKSRAKLANQPNLENMTYSDPLGPERPRTAAVRRGQQADDDFGNVDADELLPE